jgi:hypothetical protein
MESKRHHHHHTDSPAAAAVDDATEENRTLLSNLVESSQLGPAVKAVFDRGWEDTYDGYLQTSVEEKHEKIKQICHLHYEEFLNCIGNLIQVKTNIKELKRDLTSINTAVQTSGSAVVTKASELMKVRHIRVNITRTLDTMKQIQYIMTLCVKAEQQLEQKKYFSALKTLNQLERLHLPRFRGYDFVPHLMKHIHSLILLVKNNVKAQFNQWSLGVGERTATIGEAALAQAEVQLLWLETEMRKKESAKTSLPIEKKLEGKSQPFQFQQRLQRRRQTDVIFRPQEKVKGLESILSKKMASLHQKPSSESGKLSKRFTLTDEHEESKAASKSRRNSTTANNNNNNNNNNVSNNAFLSASGGGVDSAIIDSEQALESVSATLNLAPVYQCFHIYQNLGISEQFQQLFQEKRKYQCLRMVDITKIHLPAKTTLLKLMTVYFTQISGFFIIEDAIVKGGASLRSRQEVEHLFELSSVQIGMTLKDSLRQVKDVPTLLQLKYLVLLFHHTLEQYELPVKCLLEFLVEDFTPKLRELMLRRLDTELTSIISQEKYEPLYPRNYEEYSELAFRFGLIDRSVNVSQFPTSLPYSVLVPDFCESLLNVIHDFHAFALYLPIGQQTIWSATEEAIADHAGTKLRRCLTDHDVANLQLSQIIQISLNADYLSTACKFFENVLFAYSPDASGGLLKLSKAMDSLQQTKSTGHDLFFEAIRLKVEDMMQLFSNFDWVSTTPYRHCDDYIDSTCTFLRVKLSSLQFIPDNIREGVHFTSCNRISTIILRALHGRHVSKFTITAIYNLNKDLERLEEFADMCPIQDLKLTFRELRQTCNMLLSKNFAEIQDSKVRLQKYNTLHDEKLVSLLSKYKALNFMQSPPPGIAKLKAKTVSNVIKAIRS